MENKEKSTTSNLFQTYWFWIGLSVLVVLLWGANWYFVEKYMCYEQGGQFGDRFGAATSLFSGFTIIGLIYTIYQQQKQIRLQQTEITQQETNQKKDKEVALIFELLRLQNNVLESVTYNQDTGRRALKQHYDILRSRMVMPDLIKNKETYLRFLQPLESYYLHYIRTMEVIFSKIAFSIHLSQEEKLTYMIIFKSQLSTPELGLWAYDLYFEEGDGFELKSMLKKYKVFHVLSNDQVGHENHLVTFHGEDILDKISE